MNVNVRSSTAMGGACYHRSGGAARTARRLLERAYRFLTARERPEVEATADRFFRALGYRRRADDQTRLIFQRGERFASFYRSSLRSCQTRVEVELDRRAGDREGTGLLTVKHRVVTTGRLTFAEDDALLEAESKAFERFLEQSEIDSAALIVAAQRAVRRTATIKVAALIAAFAGGLATLVVFVLRSGR